MTWDTWIPLVIFLSGGVVWVLRLEGRLNVHDQRYMDIIDRLKRIEQLIDQLVRFNGH